MVLARSSAHRTRAAFAPLQQQWSYENTGDFAPTHYLQSDTPLYCYSFTDAFSAMAHKSLSLSEEARFDLMIRRRQM